MFNLATLAKGARKAVADNSPAILTAMAVAGVATTAFMTGRAVPKALEIIKEAEEEADEPLTTQQHVQLTLHCYIPAVGVGIATIACIIGSSAMHSKRNAALMSMYTLTETSFKEYQAKVTEQIGAGKERKVRDELAQEYVDKHPVSSSQVIITGGGDVLCLDTLSGRYFESSVEKIRRAQNDINALMIHDMYASQNDFYQRLGLSGTSQGEEFGWKAEELMEIDFTTTLAEDGRPCIVLNYRTQPVRNYNRFG